MKPSDWATQAIGALFAGALFACLYWINPPTGFACNSPAQDYDNIERTLVTEMERTKNRIALARDRQVLVLIGSQVSQGYSIDPYTLSLAAQ